MSTAEPVLGGFVVVRPAPLTYATQKPVGLTLLSDLHLGAPQTDYRKIQGEVDAAKENGDRILINGDVFDFILPSDKKRYTPDALHPRLHGRKNVVNECVRWAVEVLGPVAGQVDVVGCGNHETALEKHHSVDPIELLVYELQKLAPDDHVVHHGGYTGFVDYRLRRGPPGGPARDGNGVRYVVYYHHGSGGSAPVTKGMIDFNRRDTFVNADLIWLGHKHNRWNGTVEKLECPLAGDAAVVREVRHVMTGAYFKTYVGQSQKSIRENGRRSNYAADAGMAPGGRGGARVLLHVGRTRGEAALRVEVVQ